MAFLMPPSEQHLYTAKPQCTEQAIEHAATWLSKGHRVRIRVGPTKNTKQNGLGHAETEVEYDGKWYPAISKNGFSVLDETGDGLLMGTDYYLTLHEAVKRWTKPGLIEPEAK